MENPPIFSPQWLKKMSSPLWFSTLFGPTSINKIMPRLVSVCYVDFIRSWTLQMLFRSKFSQNKLFA